MQSDGQEDSHVNCEFDVQREKAVVGPVIRWAELPHRQAARVDMIEAYRPYYTVRPAKRSAWKCGRR